MHKIILGITLSIFFVNSEQLFPLTYLCKVDNINCSVSKQIVNISSKNKAKIDALQSIDNGSIGIGKCKNITLEDIKCTRIWGTVHIYKVDRDTNLLDKNLTLNIKNQINRSLFYHLFPP